MKTLINLATFRKLVNFHQIMKEYQIPFEWKLKQSKTEGDIIILHGDSKTDFWTIAICPLNADYYEFAKMIRSLLDKNVE